ncbi:hypothetical protein LVJ94_02265 [Pendulispora rubella]|uniref:YXWGXW repeat-containing protein n=1 Tax=Pendulispora rubella TaxID=2741070 RepID=A0ABZ2LBG1_9BACT
MKTHLNLLILALPVLAAGCYVQDGPPPPRHVVAYEAPPPPPPQVDVITVSPGPDYIWVGGYHRWTGHGYYWVPGHYERRGRRWR